MTKKGTSEITFKDVDAMVAYIEEHFISIDQAATLAKRNVQYTRKLVAAGKIGSIQISRAILVSRESVLNYVDARARALNEQREAKAEKLQAQAKAKENREMAKATKVAEKVRAEKAADVAKAKAMVDAKVAEREQVQREAREAEKAKTK